MDLNIKMKKNIYKKTTFDIPLSNIKRTCTRFPFSAHFHLSVLPAFMRISTNL